MKIALFGASGFIGNHLKRELRINDHDLTICSRKGFSESDSDFIANYISGQDIVINLAGAPLLSRWSETYKQELYDSRILIQIGYGILQEFKADEENGKPDDGTREVLGLWKVHEHQRSS